MVLLLWLIFIISILYAIALLLVKVPEVLSKEPVKVRIASNTTTHLSLWHYFADKFKIVTKKLWHFILEAKDLTPPITNINQQVQKKVRQIFKIRIRSSENEPAWLPEATNMVVEATEPKKSIEEVYLATIQKDPNNKQAFEGLGRLYLQEKNYEEAEEIFRYLIKLDANRDVYYSNLGLILYSLKNFKDAIVAYQKALSINNKIPTRWINLALSFLAVEDYSNAIKAATNAINLDKRNLNYLNLLADIYIKLNNRVRAEEILQQILAIDPMSKQAREKLMRLRI